MFKKYVFVSLVLSSCSVNAEIFKCVDSIGNVEFRALPCADEQKTEWVQETERERFERLRREKEKQLEEQRQASLKASQEKQRELGRVIAAKRLAEENAELRWRPTTIFPEDVKNGILLYLKRVLKDPDSLKDLEWLRTETDETNFRVTAFYRAKNGWGAYGISKQAFITDPAGNVIDMKDLN